MAERNAPSGPERRTFARLPHRMPCEFTHQGLHLTGIVTDVSARGLFIQTAHRVPAGTELRVTLRHPRGAYEVVGRVRRQERSHRSARHVVSGGFGLRLDVIPEPFFRLLIELGLG